jgi:hypothetical protein
MLTDAHNVDDFDPVTIDQIPDPIAGEWFWIINAVQCTVIANKSVSLIPGESIDISIFEKAKNEDPVALDWFRSCVARGYFGTKKTKPESESESESEPIQPTSTKRSKTQSTSSENLSK